VPLLSSPGSIEQVLTRAPELGGGLAATVEPGQTILRIAAQLEGLPQRDGAHPSAYAVSQAVERDWIQAERCANAAHRLARTQADVDAEPKCAQRWQTCVANLRGKPAWQTCVVQE
jgi:hypothetical protein